MNIIPCNRDFFVVYALQDEDGRFVDLLEHPVVAWDVEDTGLLRPIPADQLFADDNFHAIRLGDLYSGEFGGGLTRDDVLKYFNAKAKRQIEKKASDSARQVPA